MTENLYPEVKTDRTINSSKKTAEYQQEFIY